MYRSASGMLSIAVWSFLELRFALFARNPRNVGGMQSATVCCFCELRCDAVLLSLYLFQIKTHRFGPPLGNSVCEFPFNDWTFKTQKWLATGPLESAAVYFILGEVSMSWKPP